MSDIDNTNNIEPAACFDKLKTKGRPKFVLNATGIKVVESLASVMCTHDEIAACLDVTKDTLYAKHNIGAFSTAFKKGQEQGKMSLRHSQFQLAKVNATMAIFLGKQYLGQSDKPADEEPDIDETPATIEVIVEDASGGE